MQKICHGAEAIISESDGELLKERVKKGYRIKEIDDSLRAKRTKLEARLLREAKRAGIPVPHVIDEERFLLKMEFIAGKRVKDILDKSNYEEIADKIAKAVAVLHAYDIIHGDLTTSNMITKDGRIYFIDFGLGFFSKRIEDKATDIHLLHEALESTHFGLLDKIWPIIMGSYRNNYDSAEMVIKTLAKIEKRARYAER